MFDFISGLILTPIYFLLVLSPIFIFVYFFYKTKNKFFDLRSEEFELKQKYTVYKIMVPEGFKKSPKAMEMILSIVLNTGGEGDWFSKVWLGKSRPIYSLELVSIDGKVSLYIRIREALGHLLESAFLSQYPNIKLEKVKDYTKSFSYEKDADGGLFGYEAKLNKADPIPIKTYKKFGLDKDGLNPEEIIDPVSFFIETLSNIGKGENLWMQFVMRGQKKDYVKKEKGFWKQFFEVGSDEVYDWNKLAEKEIEKIREKLKDKHTDKEKKFIDEIIENVNKPSYWVGARIIYFAKKDKFNPANINPVLMMFQALTSNENNNLAYGFHTGFDYQWQDIRKKRAEKLKKDIFNDFKRRKFFNAGKKEKEVKHHGGKRYNTFVLSVDELATIFHPPILTKEKHQKLDS